MLFGQYKYLPATLCLLTEPGRILLGYKKRGLGKGLWNGFGGKLEAGETAQRAAERELEEEAGISSDTLVLCGKLFFTFDGDSQLIEGFVFRTSEYKGEPRETEEMRPRWFPLDEIPYEKMWADDVLWFPLFLRGICFLAYFHFDREEKMVYGRLRTLDSTGLRSGPQLENSRGLGEESFYDHRHKNLRSK